MDIKDLANNIENIVSNLDSSAQEDLLAYVIGDTVVRHLKNKEVFMELFAKAETRAMKMIDEIRHVLDDESLEDPECFNRIEAIVDIFAKYYIYTNRHDWG